MYFFLFCLAADAAEVPFYIFYFIGVLCPLLGILGAYVGKSFGFRIMSAGLLVTWFRPRSGFCILPRASLAFVVVVFVVVTVVVVKYWH